MSSRWWALFSVANQYDQPPNNLVGFFGTIKPSIEELAVVLNEKFPSDYDEVTLAIVSLWAGKEVRIEDTDYRLEQIGYGPARERT